MEIQANSCACRVVSARASRHEHVPKSRILQVPKIASARSTSFTGSRFQSSSLAASSRTTSSPRSAPSTVAGLGILDLIGGDLIRPNIGTFLEDLEEHGALAVYNPPEGGYEGRFAMAVGRAGYQLLNINARGLGDVEAYLTKVHGVRPAHVGKQPIQRFYEPGLLNTIMDSKPANKKGVCIWIQDGKVLSKLECSYLAVLGAKNPEVKVVVERYRGREFKWEPLKESGQKIGM
mmetsp:Transcript_13802/g.18970  ORF Transcript_13802/g.18970 Transcript_13802/m.18970 type:complete len:234 (+) Transcript_13802:75-776(+)|eukprot:CAMPEP_0196570402 /NCGR_PEP_ID=MMETSP1081-20130531/470_1 /TAXON_ID=36882 /ORGANISM="Pyramimonas amylifera, Strain CCMP720" /LENGTH=233 /DNA_ID=CAMNT_0041886819 /DNA_START=68 /DNA_END=769 /DNA_ORIENTATION=+